MSLTASVVSAAILEGNLIIGLSDGSVINCGYVQGPPGLSGEPGPMGATGDSGRDGNTILTVAGTPRNDMGKDGDYAIDNIAWRIFGPKAGGVWGKANDMLPSKDNLITNGRDFGSGSGGGSMGGGGDVGGGGPVYTNAVIATGSGRLAQHKATVIYNGGPNGILKPSGPMNFQSNINAWVVAALEQLEDAIPVAVVDSPRNGNYEGELGFYEGDLYIWVDGKWEKLGTEGGAILSVTAPVGRFDEGALWFCTAPNDLTLYVYDGTEWVPAAPPVSLDGVQLAIASIDEQLMKVNANVAMNKSELDEKALDIQIDQDRQDGEIRSLEQEIEGIIPSYDRGIYDFTSKLQELASSAGGHYAIVNRFVSPEEMCNTLLAECQAEAGGDSSAQAQCNRVYQSCIEAIEDEEGDAPILAEKWHEASWLLIDTWDKTNTLHTFKDAKAGRYIELTNSDGTGNMVALIEEDRIESAIGISQIKISVLSWKGEPSGETRIKLFEISASDPTDYVKKSGDTINGTLTIQRTRDNNNDNSFRIKGRINGEEGKNLLKDYQRKLDSTKSDYIEYFGTCDSKDSIANRDQIKALIQEFATPAKPTPTPFTWTLEKNNNSTVSDGCMAWESGKFIYLSPTTFEGIKLVKPSHLPTGANMFESYYNISGMANKARNMQVWMETKTNNWELMAWMTPYKYRFWYRGWVQIEYRSKEGSMPDEYGKRFGVTLPELF